MKKHLCSFILLLLIFNTPSHAQMTRYIIKFKDKQFNSFSISNPSAFLSARAIERRNRYNITVDSTDLPITQRYIDSVRLSGNVTILNKSKWLNSISIQTTDPTALAKINSLPFVIAATPIAARLNEPIIPVNKNMGTTNNNAVYELQGTAGTDGFYNYGASNGQVKVHRTDFLHDLGFRGEGMQLAMLDAGYLNYLTLPTFDSIRKNNQILGTWDFVTNDASVNEDYFHGMSCLSTIAANMPGVFVGTAPKTSFYLYRTEDAATEYPIEEHNLAAGFEKADSLGVNICSVSLGYSVFDNPSLNYTYANMNGNTTMGAIAADFGAKKGMLLCIAAGNEGQSSWHWLTSPSDADSVLCVGAVDTLGNIAGFSGYGPSSDGQVKPSVASVGLRTFVANPSTGMPTQGNGTSYATPNMAGVTTCLWQAFPEENNMGIIDVLQKNATKSSSPDNRVGYGMPNARLAFISLLKKYISASININECVAMGNISVKANDKFTLTLERKISTDATFSSIKSLQPSKDFTLNHFSFSDDLSQLGFGNYQYRLKIDIMADTVLYATIGSVNYIQPCAFAEEGIYLVPNPVTTNSRIVIHKNNGKWAQIAIYNSSGQRVYSATETLKPGISTFPFNAEKLASGVYFIKLNVDGEWQKTINFVK